MMRYGFARMTVTMSLATLAAACGAATVPAGPAFPATHVTLYDCGLAQIERQADVSGATTLGIDVEHAHLDDLLSTLVLATDGGVKVSGVKFPGVQNLGQAVASSGFAGSMLDGSGGLQMPSDMEGYARALVGTSVSITLADGAVVEGTVLDAVMPPEAVPVEGHPVEPPEPIMVVVTDEGALRWMPVGTVTEVAPTSELEAAAIKNFATALGKASGFAQTTLELSTTGDSEGKLAASYVRQVPVWRMMYKTTVKDGKVVLEAWAVVHNDTPEDWTDVAMTLISGLPSSYVFSVASPRYSQREVIVSPGSEGEMMPQLGAQTPDTLLYDWDIYHSSGYGFGSMGYGQGSGYGYGYGSGSGSMSGSYGAGSTASEMGSSLLAVGESAAEQTMVAEVQDEISTYTAMAKVTIPSGTTSMVPLIRRELPGEAFTLLRSYQDPATCVRIENVTGLVLQPGMATFYEDGKFCGQAEIGRLEPADIRVLCYGRDEDIAFSYESDVENVYSTLEFSKNILWAHSLRTTKLVYTIENFAGMPRDLAIEIGHIENGRVVSPEGLLETDSPTRELFVFTAPARTEIEREIVVEEGVQYPWALTVERFGAIIDEGTLPVGQVKVLEKVQPLLVEIEKIGEQVAEKMKQSADLEASMAWQKDLLATVPETGGKSAGVDKILAEIMQAKKQVDALAGEIAGLKEKSAEKHEKAVAGLEEGLKALVPGNGQ